MLLRKLGVEPEAKRDDVGWIGPEGKQASGFAGTATCDLACFQESDGVKRGVIERVASQIVGGRAPDDPAP